MYINRITNPNIKSNQKYNNTINNKYIGRINKCPDSDTISKNLSFGAESGYVLKMMYPDDKNLERYIDSISRYKTLSQKEMRELFKKKAEGGADVEKIREQLINGNLRLVLYAVKKCARNCELPVLDMIQVGNVALMKEIDKYDYKKEYTFATYALPAIRHAIMTSGRKNRGIIRVSDYMREIVDKLEKKEEHLERILSKKPSIHQLAKAMHLSVYDVIALKRTIPVTVDIDKRIYGKEDRYNFARKNSFDATNDKEYFLKEALNDTEAPGVAETVSRIEIEEAFRTFLKTLPPKAFIILQNRYGLDGEKQKTYAELGEMLNCTRSYAHQLEKKSLRKLASPENAKILRMYLRDCE